MYKIKKYQIHKFYLRSGDNINNKMYPKSY